MNYYKKYIKYKKKYLNIKSGKISFGDFNVNVDEVFISGGFIDIHKHPKKFFLDENVSKIKFKNRNIQAILLPHAGHSFIKNIIELSFCNIRPNYLYIVLLTTNHIDKNNYQPNSTIDNVKILSLDDVEKNNDHFMNEHSYLSILPYIKQFNIPMYLLSIGHFDEKIVNSLKKIINENVLLIGNTDLLHCGPEFDTEIPKNIDEYNLHTIQLILSKKDLKKNDACGIEVIKIFNSFVNDYESYIYTSSDKIIKSDTSVGYIGIVYANEINLENFSYLLSLPKKILETNKQYLGKRTHTINIDEIRKNINIPEKLYIKDISGIFITIYKNHKLRGCVGTFELLGDIIDTIINRVIETSTNDIRFEPIQENELEFLSYKINFLKKPFSIGKDIDKLIQTIKIGKHGITTKFTDGSATYLASVLSEMKTSTKTFPKSFNITEENKKEKIYEIIDSLKNKCGCTGPLIDIELYECYEM